MKWAKQTQAGFTIVELLIVVVVIAILAAITIVSYNGITAQAKEAQQIAALDKVGKAIQLYSAEEGHSMGSSDTGWTGDGYGAFTFTTTDSASYAATSIEARLRSSGYLNGSIAPLVTGEILLAPCTTEADTRWVVLAIANPAPRKSVAQQIADTGCTNALVPLYSNSDYGRNLIKAY